VLRLERKSKAGKDTRALLWGKVFDVKRGGAINNNWSHSHSLLTVPITSHSTTITTIRDSYLKPRLLANATQNCSSQRIQFTAYNSKNRETTSGDNYEEPFEASNFKLVAFKIIIICLYRSPTGSTQILFNNLQIILDYFDTRSHHIIIIDNLNHKRIKR
jgi:hypothetical protein